MGTYQFYQVWILDKGEQPFNRELSRVLFYASIIQYWGLPESQKFLEEEFFETLGDKEKPNVVWIEGLPQMDKTYLDCVVAKGRIETDDSPQKTE